MQNLGESLDRKLTRPGEERRENLQDLRERRGTAGGVGVIIIIFFWRDALRYIDFFLYPINIPSYISTF